MTSQGSTNVSGTTTPRATLLLSHFQTFIFTLSLSHFAITLSLSNFYFYSN